MTNDSFSVIIWARISQFRFNLSPGLNPFPLEDEGGVGVKAGSGKGSGLKARVQFQAWVLPEPKFKKSISTPMLLEYFEVFFLF